MEAQAPLKRERLTARARLFPAHRPPFPARHRLRPRARRGGASSLTACAGGKELKVATFNIHAGRDDADNYDLDRIAEAIEDLDVDAIALQEVDNNFDERSDFDDQAKELADKLDMHYTFGANEPKDVGGEEGLDEEGYGLAILSKMKIKDSENTHLPFDVNGKTSSEENPKPEQRGLLRATVKWNGEKVDLYSTHWEHKWDSLRERQADAAATAIAQRDMPSIVMGDLNAEPDDVAVNALLGGAVIKDALQTLEVEDPTNDKGQHIDYVLYSEAFAPVDGGPVVNDASDHYPVAVTFKSAD